MLKPLMLGSYRIETPVFVAPMAGVTDRPFRVLCKELGAGYAVSEMAASNPKLWDTVKTARRLNHDGEPGLIAVQIAGAEPEMLAQAARFNVERGAQVIDINMGCPAKKVCNVQCGSALLSNEALVKEIVRAVVKAVDVPVSLKFRTGATASENNALTIAKIAEGEGIQMLTLHGRSRAQLYTGFAEYDTIAAVKAAVKIPVVANGDITSPQKAKAVLHYTGADAVMIGRAGQGAPWLYGQVAHYLQTGELRPRPAFAELAKLMQAHLLDHYAFYGEYTGVRTARKHIQWYFAGLGLSGEFAAQLMAFDDCTAQFEGFKEVCAAVVAQA